MGGGLMTVGTRLMALGLGIGEISEHRARTFRFGRDKIGADHMGEIISGRLALASSHENPRAPASRHIVNGLSSTMTYPLSAIEGLTVYSASKLKSLGIRTTAALLEAARTVKGRKALAAKTGISEQQLLDGPTFRFNANSRHGQGQDRTDTRRRRHHGTRAGFPQPSRLARA